MFRPMTEEQREELIMATARMVADDLISDADYCRGVAESYVRMLSDEDIADMYDGVDNDTVERIVGFNPFEDE